MLFLSATFQEHAEGKIAEQTLRLVQVQDVRLSWPQGAYGYEAFTER
jgi:hypothetical protein